MKKWNIVVIDLVPNLSQSRFGRLKLSVTKSVWIINFTVLYSTVLYFPEARDYFIVLKVTSKNFTGFLT